ncbi:HAD family phosphatase [Catenovulum sp. 2E275]|uniref:HAD family hydrolase n=1 Tax=Catenovulum sp. 2E275 TaxID=2980497 RepID=UPI0021D3AF95|nr:HAD family phosphatase [Catenovulum sp. 2E275]MCU4674879.1 HAD family phosphatase [Catenovulum sp. 2E275]
MPKIAQFDAVLFDMDGTIFDSESLYSQAWVASAAHFNQHFTPDMYKYFVGVRSAECYQIAQGMFGEAFDMQPFIEFFRRYLSAEKAKNMPLKPGFKFIFEQLKQTGVKLGLVTSSRQASVAENFANLPYLQYFDLVISGDDVTEAKPAAECYLKACKQLNVLPQKTLVFEDSNPGALAAIRAGCHTIVIPDLLPIQTDIQQQAHALFDDFYQVQQAYF